MGLYRKRSSRKPRINFLNNSEKMVDEIRFGKLRFCRICGKKGIKFASDGCKYCGSPWIDNIGWQIKRKQGLTEVIDGIEVLKKKSSKKVIVETVNHINKKIVMDRYKITDEIKGVLGWVFLLLLDIYFLWMQYEYPAFFYLALAYIPITTLLIMTAWKKLSGKK